MLACRLMALPEPVREYRFCPPRRWRFDFAWPVAQVAVEIEGGEFVGGRHGRGVYMAKDCEKYNQATVMGWRLLRFTGAMVRANPLRCAGWVLQVLKGGRGRGRLDGPSEED